jgi:hypothetical protein
MNYVNRKQKQMSVRQKGIKLSLTISDVRSVKTAIMILKDISDSSTLPPL